MTITKAFLKYFRAVLCILLVCTTNAYAQKHDNGCDASVRGEETESIRIVSWNIEHLGKRSPIRTTAQRKLIGERMLDMNAEIFMLQEIDVDSAFATVVNQMNALSGQHWIAYRNAKQNALVYNADKLEIIEAPNHWSGSGNTGYPQSSTRPPVTAVFRAVGSTYNFRVIGIHAHPNNEQVRIAQAKWLSDKIGNLVDTPGETHYIILCGDYNTGGSYQSGLLQVFRDSKILFNVPKENGPGTGWDKREESDYFSTTSSAMTKIKGGTCYINEPEVYGESFSEFEATYSDHFPVLIDCIIR